MKSITTPKFIEAFNMYYFNAAYPHALNTVKKEFITVTGCEEIKGNIMMYSEHNYFSYLSGVDISVMSQVLCDMDKDSLTYHIESIKESIVLDYIQDNRSLMTLIPTFKMLRVIKDQVDKRKRLEWSNSLVRKLLFLSGILIYRKDGYSAFYCERTSFLAREILKNLFGDKLPQQAKLYFKKSEYFYR